MSRTKKLCLAAAALAAFGTAILVACGPFFGVEALQNRREYLLAPPTISFEAELKSLVPAPSDKLPVVEAGPTRSSVDAAQLSPAILARVTSMDQQETGDAAYALGQGLPPAVQLYTAGAVSFRHSQNASARTYFQSVLSLPVDTRKTRELWASFMLGRIAIQQGDRAQAAAHFDAVRALVRQGAPDEFGLAVASLGEQALGEWRQRDVAKTVELYARQAAYGSSAGANSLVAIAALILKDQDLLDRAIADPLARHLLFICVNGNNARPFFTDFDAAKPADSAKPADNVARIAAALDRANLPRVEGAGLLASAAYAHGSFDLAQKLAAREDSPMSAWVLAKLSLRAGDRENALKQFDTAIGTFQPSLGRPTQLRTDLAVLRVSRGDYLQALDLFYRAAAENWTAEYDYSGFADYWGDAAYLAERVLSLDELRNYADTKLPLTAGATAIQTSERARFRAVLARRLMRASRWREALPYFENPKDRADAEEYGRALDRSASWYRTRLARAEAWFTAATLARRRGMALLAFEKEPDFAMWNGSFGDDANPPANKPPDSYQAPGEQERVAASRPQRDRRFQYRLTAVDEALKSADLLPPRSQAFAAVLCECTRWVIDREPRQAAQVYRRYLEQGPHVPWGRAFGRACPPPDFAASSTWNATLRRIGQTARHVRSHRLPAILLAASALAILALALYFRRARSTSL